MYKIIVTVPAERDLQDAVLYISNELKNQQTAINLLDLVEKAVNSLTDMPERKEAFAKRKLWSYK